MKRRAPHREARTKMCPKRNRKTRPDLRGSDVATHALALSPTVAEGAYMVDGDELSHIFDASASYAFDSLRSSPDCVLKRHDDYAFLEATVNGENFLVRPAKQQTVAGTQHAQAVEEVLTDIAPWAAIRTKDLFLFHPRE